MGYCYGDAWYDIGQAIWCDADWRGELCLHYRCCHLRLERCQGDDWSDIGQAIWCCCLESREAVGRGHGDAWYDIEQSIWCESG